MKLSFVLGALLSILTFVDGRSLRVASYNIRVFGRSKQRKPIAMDIITEIIRKYDVIQLQEVRMNLELGWLQKQVGDDYAVCKDQMDKAISKEAFKPKNSRHREMYLFLYRKEVIDCVKTVECENIKNCPTAFRRAPTAALFQIKQGEKEKKQFFIIGIHTQPKKALGEIESLPKVYNAFRDVFKEALFGAVMGDFNYGGRYVLMHSMDKLTIDSELNGLLDKNAKTSVKSGHPYDRIYVTKGIPFVFTGHVDEYMGGLKDKHEYYKIVSDHYPVYFDVSINLSNEKDFKDAIISECSDLLGEMDEIVEQKEEDDMYFACDCCHNEESILKAFEDACKDVFENVKQVCDGLDHKSQTDMSIEDTCNSAKKRVREQRPKKKINKKPKKNQDIKSMEE